MKRPTDLNIAVSGWWCFLPRPLCVSGRGSGGVRQAGWGVFSRMFSWPDNFSGSFCSDSPRVRCQHLGLNARPVGFPNRWLATLFFSSLSFFSPAVREVPPAGWPPFFDSNNRTYCNRAAPAFPRVVQGSERRPLLNRRWEMPPLGVFLPGSGLGAPLSLSYCCQCTPSSRRAVAPTWVALRATHSSGYFTKMPR